MRIISQWLAATELFKKNVSIKIYEQSALPVTSELISSFRNACGRFAATESVRTGFVTVVAIVVQLLFKALTRFVVLPNDAFAIVGLVSCRIFCN